MAAFLLCSTPAVAQLDAKYPDSNDQLAVPFEITTIQGGQFADDTHWYRIRVASGKSWHTRQGESQVYCTQADYSQGDEYLWCFTGDNISGFRLYNKAKGAGFVAYVSSGQNYEPLRMETLGNTKEPRTFKVSVNANGYNFYYPTKPNSCLNDLHAAGAVGLWVNDAASTDAGSRMSLELVAGDADVPSAEGLPFKPTKRLADGSLASNTHWYTMTIRGNKTIYPQKSDLVCGVTGQVVEDQLWAFVGDAENGFEIFNYTTGTSARAYAPKGSNECGLMMESKPTTSGTYKWMLSTNNQGGYNLYYPKNPISCWNDFDNKNWIAIWRSQDAKNDLGSCIVFTEQNLNTVGQFVPVKSIEVEQPNISLYPGEKQKINAIIKPQDASNRSLWYFTLDPTICSVNEATGEVTAIASGQTTIVIYTTDGSQLYTLCHVTVKDGSTLLPVQGPVLYVHRTDGGIDAFPESLLSSYNEADNGRLSITATDGTSFTYTPAQYTQATHEAPSEFAAITSFKINNKYNPDIVQDAQATIINDSLIQFTVAGIGKWLTPSFKVADGFPGDGVYVDGQLQTSKVSRCSFAQDVVYTVSRPGYQMLRSNVGGQLKMRPFGKDYVVQATFLTDSPTSDYNVPSIYLTTADGRLISSKTTYKDGTIRIDGAGVFPDLEETPMKIKGRGNSSWTGSEYGKNPYHLKFDEKTGVLGLGKGKHWNLIANAQRMSMMCNAIGMKIARMVGTEAANDEVPVELYINGKYRGSYNLTQKVGFGNNSLDVKDTLPNAALLELDSYFDEPIRFRTASTFYALPVNVKEPEEFGLPGSDIDINDIKQRFINGFLRSLRAGTGVEAHADVHSMATFLMTNELVCNYELMHPKSTFYYCRDILSPDSLFRFGPVWDLDYGYGYERYNTYFQMPPTEDFWTGANYMEAPAYIYDLRYNSGEAFEREYFRVWTDFIQNHLQELLDFCEEYQQYAQPSFDHNDSMWGYQGSYEGQVKEAQQWLSERANHIYNHLAHTLGLADKYPDVVDDPTPVLDIAEDRTTPHAVDQSVYTLDGRKVDATKRLPRGIYIIGGRKVAIK